MAIGQLLDYRRFIEESAVQCAVLVPEVPRQDLLQFLDHAIERQTKSLTPDERTKVRRERASP